MAVLTKITKTIA
uniref:Uncharacterized protein n=1 Tax=Anguilla anguilla TaxID=7936 RepID=A0A0E9UGJ4_ANGAN